MQLDEAYRADVRRTMVDVMISGLESGTLSSNDLPLISARILDELPAAITHQQLVAFLESMSQQWPMFGAVANMEMGKVIESKKEAVIHQMLQHAKAGNLDEAVKTAQILKPSQ